MPVHVNTLTHMQTLCDIVDDVAQHNKTSEYQKKEQQCKHILSRVQRLLFVYKHTRSSINSPSSPLHFQKNICVFRYTYKTHSPAWPFSWSPLERYRIVYSQTFRNRTIVHLQKWPIYNGGYFFCSNAQCKRPLKAGWSASKTRRLHEQKIRIGIYTFARRHKTSKDNNIEDKRFKHITFVILGFEGMQEICFLAS